MSIAVIDIGSNTARLLVAEADGRRVQELWRDRRYLRLGEDVHAFGAISPEKLDETADVARRFAQSAYRSGVERITTIVTAPGRQASNGADLIDLLAEATNGPVTQLSGNDEGRLAWEGAVGSADDLDGSIAVVDLGGGSCELAVGSTTTGPTWVRSVDAGALRVTRTYLEEAAATPEGVAAARQGLARMLDVFVPPAHDAALAVGGTARAVSRIIGSRFDAEQLEGLAATLQRVPLDAIVRSHGITPERARTLLGGTLVLLELAHRLAPDFEVVRGGVREGAALRLVGALPAAA